MTYVLMSLFSIIVLFFIYLPYRIFLLLVEIVNLKKFLKNTKSKKRFIIIRYRIKKAHLKKKARKGRFSSIIHQKVKT